MVFCYRQHAAAEYGFQEMVVLACIKLRFPLTEVAYFFFNCNYIEMLERKEAATGSLPPQKPPNPPRGHFLWRNSLNSGFGRLIVEASRLHTIYKHHSG